MSEGGPKRSHEIPVQQTTVVEIAEVTNGLMGKRSPKVYCISDVADRTTRTEVRIVSDRGDSWKIQRMSVGHSFDIIVDETASVLGDDRDDRLKTQHTRTAWLLKTHRSRPPVLLLEGKETKQQESGKPAPDGYTIPSNEEANSLLATLKTLEKSGIDITDGEKKDYTADREQLESELNRIFAAAEDYIPVSDIQDIKLSLGIKTVALNIGPKDRMNVSIEQPVSQENGEEQIVSENYTSLPGMPIGHTRSTVGKSPKLVSLLTAADSGQTNYLLGVLEALSTEKVQAELAARSAIRRNVDTILQNQELTFDGRLRADIERGYVDISVAQDPSMTYVLVRNRVNPDAYDNTDNISEQEFYLNRGRLGTDEPLTVRTYTYGESLEAGSKMPQNATESETLYIATLLDELAKDPPLYQN